MPIVAAAMILVAIASLGVLLYINIPPPPPWVYEAVDGLTVVVGWIYKMDSWIPVTFTFSAAAAVIAGYFLAVAIQFSRTVISYFTMGGGAT